ncbi:MAG: right-handed parallel beta-helix repeat-containing protein [Candidatus Moranbacteria bacterium]|nr:right-handed parallel beta-helix repeat-containing protein [Candidatus Moranbacteria bacterium]
MEEIKQYGDLALFLVPLGIIGIWRWSVWLLKKIIALFYRLPDGQLREGTLAIIVPVYNEKPAVFEAALYFWQLNGNPDELIAVIDHSDKDCIGIFRKFAEKNATAKLLITSKPGKRPALADGIKLATTEFVALVDSDTIWTEPIKSKVLRPFSDPKVGGVATRQNVYVPDTLSKKLFQIHLDNRYLNEMPFLAAFGDALTCLSGRTAVYRRSAIIQHTDELVEEKFLGQNVISGDDKTLTRLVQKAGWKVRYVQDAVVSTPGFGEISPFLKQFVRWNRNSWRSDLKTLSESWVWRRNKILAFHMIDRFFQPFTLLLGPVYFFVAISRGYWQIIPIFLAWWIISRSIKIYGHLKKYPDDILIMPHYVLFTFVSAVIKIYALLTVGQQGWITRWDDSRLKKVSPLKKMAAYLGLFFILAGYFSAVSLYSQKNLYQPALSKENGATSAQSPELDSIPTFEILQKKEAILARISGDAYGFYTIQPGDSLGLLRNKFNIGSISTITYEHNAPIANPNLIPAGRKIMVPVRELQNPLDPDILLDSRNFRQPPVIFFNAQSNTIHVKNAGSVVTLSKIRRALLDNSVPLEETGPGEWILRSNLYIGKNVTLVLDQREADYLKLKSDDAGHIWIRSQGGNILISGIKITSWDENKGAPDIEYATGRSHIVAKGSGRMDIIDSEIAYLGYEGLPRRGGPFGGSYGLSWKITSGKFKDNLLTGSVINSSIHDNYFGIYTFGVTGAVIKDNQVFNNIRYGIDPHDDSNNMLISRNRTFSNGTHGIILSKRCYNNTISENISFQNRLHGIMLHKLSDRNIVIDNTAYQNTDGLAIYESNNNIVLANNLYGNKQGIRINRDSSANYLENNRILSNASGFHLYQEARGNTLINNTVKNNGLGISLQNASENTFYNNLKPFENKKDAHITNK